MLSTENQSSSHKHFSTSLQDSVRRNDFEHFDFSSVQQFNFTTPLFSQKLEFRDSRRFPALHYAVACGDLKATKYFLGRQFDIETRDTEGNTPLMWAVRKMNLQIVSLLVEEYGANVNVQDNSGNSPLIIAASNPFASEMVLYLLEHGAKPNIGNIRGETPLHVACACNALTNVQYLVEHGAWLEAVDEEGDTPLHFAVREGHVEIVEWLLSVGADKHHPNDDDESPFILATILGDHKVLAVFENSQKEQSEQNDADVGSADARDVKLSSCELKDIPNTSAMEVEKGAVVDWKTEHSLRKQHHQHVN